MCFLWMWESSLLYEPFVADSVFWTVILLVAQHQVLSGSPLGPQRSHPPEDSVLLGIHFSGGRTVSFVKDEYLFRSQSVCGKEFKVFGWFLVFPSFTTLSQAFKRSTSSLVKTQRNFYSVCLYKLLSSFATRPLLKEKHKLFYSFYYSLQFLLYLYSHSPDSLTLIHVSVS